MRNVVQARLIKIGNSQGLRLPKVVLEQSGISEEVEIEVQKDGLVIRPKAVSQVRSGWAKAFAEMAAQGDDRLLDEVVLTDWAESEWEW
jgi:antitoxin MazE